MRQKNQSKSLNAESWTETSTASQQFPGRPALRLVADCFSNRSDWVADTSGRVRLRLPVKRLVADFSEIVAIALRTNLNACVFALPVKRLVADCSEIVASRL